MINSHSQAELGTSVEHFLNQVLEIQDGEKFLIYHDPGSDESLLHAIESQSKRQGVQTERFTLTHGLSLKEQAQALSDVIENGAYDLICELSEQYFYHTDCWKTARRKGARILSIAGLNSDAFIRCIGQVDHQAMFAFGMLLKRHLQNTKSLRIFSDNGTDLQMKFQLNPILKLLYKSGNSAKPVIHQPCGRLTNRVRSTFLGGQLAFSPIPGTINGSVIIDSYMWPPNEIGMLDNEDPVIASIKKGRVVDISGCAEKTKVLKRWFDGNSIPVPHFCIGFNPGARLNGKILEAERVFGCISVGMGLGPCHTDAVIRNPSMVADGKVIEDNGKFPDEPFRNLEKELLR